MPIEALESRIAPAVLPNPLVVTTLSDVAVAEKNTLRQAIAYAEANSPDGTITFTKGLHGTIKINEAANGGAPIAITSGITIDGLSTNGVGTVVNNASHNAITLSGGGKYEIFNIDSASAVTINNLSFTSGKSSTAGGAIYDMGGGGLNISGSSFTGNKVLGTSTGGGADGVSTAGGAISEVKGNLSLTNSKLSGNTVTGGLGSGTGGAASGGAVYLAADTTGYFSGNTFLSNSATGGKGTSISGGEGRGGAIFSVDGNVTIHASSFSGNTATGGSSAGNYISPAVHGGSGNAAGGALYVGSGATAIISNNSAFSKNSARGGSGLTGKTGITGPGAFEQGGYGYSGGYAGTASGGAIAGEAQFSITVTTISGNTAVGGNGANGGMGGKGGPGGHGGGGGNGTYGGNAFGGAIAVQHNTSTLSLSDSTVSGNTAIPGKGGKGGAPGPNEAKSYHGVTAHGGYSYGGAVDINGSTSLSINAASITKNSATTGGGIHAYLVATTTVKYATIASNSAQDGGGIDIVGNSTSGTATFEYSTISANKASSKGGGIYAYQQTMTVGDCTIAGNSAGAGGGISTNSPSFILENSTVAFNSAITAGGGVELLGSTATVFSSVIASNTVHHNGIGPDFDGTAIATYSAFGSSSGLTISNISATTNLKDMNFLLEALHNNGGPTETILFQDSGSHVSALLNAGDNTMGNFVSDQRGDSPDPHVRTVDSATPTVGDGTDIGATEDQAG